MSVLRAVRGDEEEVRGEALARATREVRREKLKSIVKVGWVVCEREGGREAVFGVSLWSRALSRRLRGCEAVGRRQAPRRQRRCERENG
jgi:hypothetical protein